MECEDLLAGVKHRVDPYRVLLVDDHALVREVLRALLEDYRELVIIGEAADGREAISKAAALKPDIIVMDVNMPCMNGHDATKRIKQVLPETTVIAISINDSPQMRELMKEAGAEAFVSKVAATEQLYQVIEKVVQTRNGASTAYSP